MERPVAVEAGFVEPGVEEVGRRVAPVSRVLLAIAVVAAVVGFTFTGEAVLAVPPLAAAVQVVAVIGAGCGTAGR